MKDSLNYLRLKNNNRIITVLFTSTLLLNTFNYSVNKNEQLYYKDINKTQISEVNKVVFTNLSTTVMKNIEEAKEKQVVPQTETKEVSEVKEEKKELTEEEKEDLYLLAKIIQCEESSQERKDLDSKVAIGLVVLNRVKNKSFPKTIRGVIFQKNQFSPTFDGTWDRKEPTDFDYEAANLALQNKPVYGNDGELLNNALYFMDRDVCSSRNSSQRNLRWFDSSLKYIDKKGVHEFFTE